MSRQARTNLILFLILICVSGFVYWFEIKHKPQKEKLEENRKKLLALDSKKELKTLTIQYKPSNLSLVLECIQNCATEDAGSKWEIKSPIQFPADETATGAFITSLSNAVVNDKFNIEQDLEAELSKYGLKKEQRDEKKVSLEFKDNQKINVYFGESTPVGGNLYTYVEEGDKKISTIFMIPESVIFNLSKGLNYWRSKRLFNFAGTQVYGIKLKNDKNFIELERKERDWYFKNGERADAPTVDTFITGIVYFNALDYVSDNKAKDGVKFFSPNPKYSLELSLKEKDDKFNKIKFDIYEEKNFKTKSNKNIATPLPKLYGVISNKDFIVEIDRASIEKFNKTRLQFKDKQIIIHDVLKKIEFADVKLKDGKTISLQFDKFGKTSLVQEEKGRTFDVKKYDQFLNKLSAARIIEFKEDGKLPKNFVLYSSWSFKDSLKKEITSFEVYGEDKSSSEIYIKFKSKDVGRFDSSSGVVFPSKYDDFFLQEEKKNPVDNKKDNNKK
jgi:hypothetical protein